MKENFRLLTYWISLVLIVLIFGNGCDSENQRCNIMELPVVHENLKLEFQEVSVPESYVLYLDGALAVDKCSGTSDQEEYGFEVDHPEPDTLLLNFGKVDLLVDGIVHVQLLSCEIQIPEDAVFEGDVSLTTEDLSYTSINACTRHKTEISYRRYTGIADRMPGIIDVP